MTVPQRGCVRARRRCAPNIGHVAAGREQRGLTLLELLIAMTLGLLICSAMVAVFLTGRDAYAMVEDSTRMDDSGRYAIETITRAVRQSGFIDWGAGTEVPSDAAPAVRGLDARSLKSNGVAIESPLPRAVNGSDVLALRFGGAGSGPSGDGSVANCAGFGVGEVSVTGQSDPTARPDGGTALPDRLNGASIFYVAHDRTGEPELYCKYRGKTAWASVAIARGVESFQVLYGVGASATAYPARFLTATQVDALDDRLLLHGVDAIQREREKNRRSHWKKVSAIRFALLVHGAQSLRKDRPTATYDLFGADYGTRFGATDLGSRVTDAAMNPQQRKRMRRVFSAIVRVRNPPLEALAPLPTSAAASTVSW